MGYVEKLKKENKKRDYSLISLFPLLTSRQRIYILGKSEKGFLSTWMMFEKLERVADRLHGIGKILKESNNLNKSQKQYKKKIFELISNKKKEHKTVLPSFYNNDPDCSINNRPLQRKF